MKVGPRKESRNCHFSVARASFHSAEALWPVGLFMEAAPLCPFPRKPTLQLRDLGTLCAALPEPEHQTLLRTRTRKSTRPDRNPTLWDSNFFHVSPDAGLSARTGREAVAAATVDGEHGHSAGCRAAEEKKRKVNGSVTIWRRCMGRTGSRFGTRVQGPFASLAPVLPWCRDPGFCCCEKRTTACTAHTRPCRLFSKKKHRDQRIAVSFRHQQPRR
jgi:hypothetical protein